MDSVMEQSTEVAQVPIDDFISPAQKLIFLKYFSLNNDFIRRPQNYPKLLQILCREHNKVFCEITTANVLAVIENWVENVKSRFNQMVLTRKSFSFASEDVELLNLINADKQKPSSNELSCIVDHLEIAYSSPKVWLTISLEMEALGSKNDEEYWKKSFEKWCNKVKRKKQILDQMDIQPAEKSSFLNSLEIRVLDLIDKIETHQEKREEYFCRICLQTRENELKNIYDEYSDGLSLAQKISQCANVQEVIKDDNLPQYICESCHQLLETAYKFKHLCELSDQQLRQLAKTKVYVEYIIQEEPDEFESQTIEEVENSTDETITIEMNLPFDEDLGLVDKNCIESEMSQQFEGIVKDEVEQTTVLNNDATEMCDICGIICYNKSTLKKHFATHSYPRPHHCDVCEKVFKTKLSLRIHMRSHTGERPYVCETCGKAFKTWSAVTSHRAIHSEIKLFECPLCPYKGSTKSNLKIHNRTHTGIQPYACKQCPLKFSTASNRNKHIKNVHQKIKSHKCTSCTRSFFSRESARKHMVIHTGLKPYACAECTMAYGWYNGLQKHMKTQHPGIKMPTEKYFLDLLEK